MEKANLPLFADDVDKAYFFRLGNWPRYLDNITLPGSTTMTWGDLAWDNNFAFHIDPDEPETLVPRINILCSVAAVTLLVLGPILIDGAFQGLAHCRFGRYCCA